MARYGILVDYDYCTGCHTCEVACQQEHDAAQERLAAAEAHVRALLSRAYIVRTAWLYAPGGRNFIHAILRRARETGTVRVVTDEVGNPTYAADLAAAIAQLITTGQYGVYHFVNSGACSRWAFANEILRLAGVAQQPVVQRRLAAIKTFQPMLRGQRLRCAQRHFVSQGALRANRSRKPSLVRSGRSSRSIRAWYWLPETMNNR